MITIYPNFLSKKLLIPIIRLFNIYLQLLVEIMKNFLWYIKNFLLFTLKLVILIPLYFLEVIHWVCLNNFMEFSMLKRLTILQCSVFITVHKETSLILNNVSSKQFIMLTWHLERFIHKFWPIGWIYRQFMKYKKNLLLLLCVCMKD